MEIKQLETDETNTTINVFCRNPHPTIQPVTIEHLLFPYRMSVFYLISLPVLFGSGVELGNLPLMGFILL